MARRNNKYDPLEALESGIGLSHQYDSDTGMWITYDPETGMTREELLVEYQEVATRLNAISGVYQKGDRIISGDEITVSVVNDPTMTEPAKNNGRDIVFNANAIKIDITDMESDSIIALNGLNYHELSHILFTPRIGSNLGQYVKENKFTRANNILEEGRAEALLTAKYPITRLFLEANAVQNVMSVEPDEVADLFPVVTGRTYLPMELRQLVADKFIAKYGKPLAQELHSLIHEYRTLVFPADFDRAKAITQRMATLVGRDDDPTGGEAGKAGFNTNDPHAGNMPSRGRPENTKEQQRLQDRNSKENAPMENLNGFGHEAGVEPDDSIYDGEDKDFTAEEKLILNNLSKRLDEIKNDRTIKREISNVRKAIANSDEMRSSMRSLNTTQRTPSVGAIGLARKFGRELERIIKDSEPHWNRRLPSGKLNVTRTMNPDINAIGQMFDEWDTGNPNTEIEAVILTDNSGSMGSRMTQVCENSWIMKRGIEKINGSVTVYSFNHESKLVYDKSEKAKATQYEYVYSGGNTNPIRALVEGERLLSTSKKPIKLAFIITDGEWEREEECDSIIKRMNANGVLTCVIFIGDVGRYKEIVESSRTGDMYSIRALQRIRHNAKVFKAVAEPSDVLKLATALVKETLTK